MIFQIIMKTKIEVGLRPVSKMDYKFLYRLLKERDPHANISHKKMPAYKDHLKFVKSKPYSKWYVIEYKKDSIGTIYLSRQNEIGIFLKKGKQGKGIGQKAMKLLIQYNPRPRFLANVSPRNTKSMKFFEHNGFRLIQYTYELIIPDLN